MAEQQKSIKPWSYAALAAMIVLAVGGGIYITLVRPLLSPPTAFSTPYDAAPTLHAARQQMAIKGYAEAERLCIQVLQHDPDCVEAVLIAGEAARQRGRLAEALAYYQRIPRRPEAVYRTGQAAATNVLIALGRLSDAESTCREILQGDPQHVAAHRQMAFLLDAEGRRWESLPHLWQLIRLHQFSVLDLLLLGNQRETTDHSPLLERALIATPGDPLPQLGLARIAYLSGRDQEAGRLIHDVLATRPDLVEAHVVAGELLRGSQNADQFHRWNRQLPERAVEHPGIWFVRGAWLDELGQTGPAIRCLWETVLRDPGHREANYRLGRLLVAEGKPSEADRFLTQAKRLDELFATLLPMHTRGPDAEGMVRAARLLHELQRPWEAWAWFRWALTTSPSPAAFQAEMDSLAKVLEDPQLPRVLPAGNPALALDLSTYPLPELNSGGSAKPSPSILQTLAGPQPGTPKFRTVTDQLDIDFVYHNGVQVDAAAMEIYHELGGGLAVLDYDLDGWPDLYFAQGSDWPPEASAAYLDRLYRNLSGRRFQNVSSSAAVNDRRYSQGVAVGDYNNDGFPDLLVANIGCNRLFRNEGDGTFTDVTEQAGVVDALWSTSCVIADLNGDGLSDLYVVNYLHGREPFETHCSSGGKRRACRPHYFRGEQDQLWLNAGDGTFQDVTKTSGVVAADGKGLGVVAADFDLDGLLDLFVANDSTANFFFVNETQPRGSAPQFVERGLVSGLAFDRDGKPQACMGIAIDDADRDGMFDMLVTNFYNEPNAYYRQTHSQLFVDDGRAAMLREPSLLTLGFGTQFIDLELDGWPDLVVTNGHVGDFRGEGMPFHMQPQAFQNLGQGRFAELSAPSLGSFFESPHLGRALARWDWNRDGRQDFAVLHLYEPAAVLENVTVPHGRFLRLMLHGVADARDAIGATAWVTIGRQTIMKQLVAGDGFQASNQRDLHFGLGQCDRIDMLFIRWPNGMEQRWRDLAPDQHLVLVQGRPGLIQQ